MFDPIKNVVTDIVMKITSFPTDLLIIVVLAVVFFVISYYIGQKKFVTALLAFYPAALIYTLFPQSLLDPILVSDSAIFTYLSKLGILIAFFVLSLIVLRKYVKNRAYESGKKDTVFMILTALSAVVLVLCAVVVIVPIGEVYLVSPILRDWITENTLVWWILSPLVVLYLFSRA